MGLDQSLKGAAKLNALVAEVKLSKADVFDSLCRQWEQASQIRKWTQEMKKDLTESFKKECTTELLKEINEKLKKEKEEKKDSEEKTDTDKDAVTKDDEKPKAEESKDKSVEETKTEEVKVVDDKKEESDDKKAEEKKGDDKKDDEKKDDEKKDDEKKEDEEDDDDEFTGPLNPEQEATVEDRAFEKMEKQLKITIESAVGKAQFVLKMSIPEAYSKQKTEDLQRELSRKQSENILLESQGSGL